MIKYSPLATTSSLTDATSTYSSASPAVSAPNLPPTASSSFFENVTIALDCCDEFDTTTHQIENAEKLLRFARAREAQYQ